MKKINWKKNVATLMGMVCAFSCTVANVDTNATPMVNAASITGTIEDVMNTAINATKEVSAIETNSKYNMTSTSRAVDAVPHYRNVGKRSSQNYNKIIDQFNVAKNPRYRVTNGSTWCNIYAWDVMRAMNVPFSHWIANGKPLTYKEAKKTKGAYECGVTRHLKWLNTYGSKYGWRKVSANEAQKRANKGYPTLVMNTSGTHIAVVRPETSKYKYSTNNPVISQAGAYNVNYGKVKTYFGTTNNLVYWTHE